jgi:DNA-binding HxlR family transcriptional regulator
MVKGHDGIEPADPVAHQTVSRDWDRDLVPDKRGETPRPEPTCPVEVALAAVAGRWTTLILRDLMHGPRSYSELRASLPQLSDKVLAERLRQLHRQGLLARERRSTYPPRTSYSLTDAGKQLRPLLTELYRTGAALLEAH